MNDDTITVKEEASSLDERLADQDEETFSCGRQTLATCGRR